MAQWLRYALESQTKELILTLWIRIPLQDVETGPLDETVETEVLYHIDNNTQNNSIETQIEHFLKKNAWLIGGVTFLLLLILCGSIGLIHLSQALKCFKMNRTNDGTHPTNQKPQSSNSSRHEPDYSNIPSGSIRTNCSVKSTLTKQLSNTKESNQSCEYSKPTTKKRYSFIWRSSVSQEVTLCPDVSEDEEVCDDFGVGADTTSGVQISGLPKGSVKISGLPQEKSFKTFQSLDEKEEADYGANTAYGNVWE
ncbi:uncharacterized protein LOC134274136 [Saccostrea cucullata]|uniref:uncharacterized protein LOC134274136 n=1 Tax=Saccostrea cuccullata TaxID=36930 RepID=UPI002ED631AD